MTGYDKAMNLIMSGRLITSHEANEVIGWKWGTRFSEVIRDLRKEGIEVEKTRYGFGNRFMTYKLKENK